MKRIILMLAILIFTTSNVQAAYWVDSCVNDTHMVSEFVLESNGSVLVDLRQAPVYCDFGCNTISGKCNPIPQTNTYYHAIGLLCLIMSMYLMYAIIKASPRESDGL